MEKFYHILALISISLANSEIQHPFMYILIIWISSWLFSHSKLVPIFFSYWIVYFFLNRFRDLYVLRMEMIPAMTWGYILWRNKQRTLDLETNVGAGKTYSKQRCYMNTCTLKDKAIPFISSSLRNQTQTPMKSPVLPEMNRIFSRNWTNPEREIKLFRQIL